MEAKEYFSRRTISNPELKEAMPELLKVINDLKPLRTLEQQTDEYIDKWLMSKVTLTKAITVEGKRIEAYINEPDMTEQDKYVEWLFFYFQKQYEEKEGKTISYAFAYLYLLQYHNGIILNKRRIGTIYEELPNYNFDDIYDEIASEKQQKKQPEKEAAVESYKVISNKPLKLKELYEYLIEDEVIEGTISETEFIECIMKANMN